VNLVSYLIAASREGYRNLAGRFGKRPPAAPPAEGTDPSLELARLYHALRREPMERVDDTIWQDLGMDEVFQKLDLTVSMPGRQFLYDRMRVLEPEDAVLAERTRQYAVLQANPAPQTFGPGPEGRGSGAGWPGRTGRRRLSSMPKSVAFILRGFAPIAKRRPEPEGGGQW
jgi:hypothetical protein